MLASENECTGCSVCSVNCPQNCIKMIEDEQGFYYPHIDESSCIHCGRCEKICPVINLENVRHEETICYCAQNTDDEIRTASSAGGVAGAIADHVISQNGIIYACGFTANNTVKFYRIQNHEEIEKYKVLGSKYVSSQLHMIVSQIVEDVIANRQVCFIGLPCQVAAIKKLTGDERKNLLLIDLTCYGAPSSKVYENYLCSCEEKYKSKIKRVNFRDKTYGYSATSMTMTFEDGKTRGQNSFIKSYLRAYFSNLICRKACYDCKFKTINRVSDITIGDFRSVWRFVSEFDDDKGTTVMYIHTSKGMEVLNEIQRYMRITRVSVEDVLHTDGKKMINSMEKNQNRDNFFQVMNNHSYTEAVKTYCPPKSSEYLANILKTMLRLFGLNHSGLLKTIKRR